MHTDCGWCEGVVRWEHEGSPVLAVVVGSVWGSGEDVVPSVMLLVEGCGCVEGQTNSRILDSEGWAIMNGGGLLMMFWYSRVSCVKY